MAKFAAPKSSQGSRSVIATGLTIVLLAASSGANYAGGYGLLLCFLGLVTGVNLMVVGIWMADNPSTTTVNVPRTTFPGTVVLAAFMRRNLAMAGLMAASSAVAAVAGEASPVLCRGFFALLLLGVSLITAGVLALTVEVGDGVVERGSSSMS